MDFDGLFLLSAALALIFGLMTAQIARLKGRNFVGWWLYGALCFPISLIHALLVSSKREPVRRKDFAPGAPRCPHCAEVIKFDAEVCPHCWRVVPRETVPDGPVESP